MDYVGYDNPENKSPWNHKLWVLYPRIKSQTACLVCSWKFVNTNPILPILTILKYVVSSKMIKFGPDLFSVKIIIVKYEKALQTDCIHRRGISDYSENMVWWKSIWWMDVDLLVFDLFPSFKDYVIETIKKTCS